MPRPQSKQELIDIIHKERTKLDRALEALSEQQKCQGGACGDWSVKDILAHLVDWERRCLRWYRAGLRGEAPKTPDANFNWRELPALNHMIYETYRDWPLADVEQAYQMSFEETLRVLDHITEDELFTPNAYPWTGNSLLRDYLNSSTASHYRWASKLIRKFAKDQKSFVQNH